MPLAFPDVDLVHEPDLGRARGEGPRLGHGHEAVVRILDVARHVNGEQRRRREEQRGDHFLFIFSSSRQSLVVFRTHQML